MMPKFIALTDAGTGCVLRINVAAITEYYVCPDCPHTHISLNGDTIVPPEHGPGSWTSAPIKRAVTEPIAHLDAFLELPEGTPAKREVQPDPQQVS